MGIGPKIFVQACFHLLRELSGSVSNTICGQTEGQARSSEGLRTQAGNSKIVNNM